MTHPFTKLAVVRSADGTRLAVFEAGNPEGPVVVALHGFPDNHSVWDGLAAELGDRFRVIAYDVRGAGESDKPTARAAYRLDRLSEDFRAVIDGVSPDAPVHLVAHDWGSIQSWRSMTDPSFTERVATFTSISGPALDYCAVWMRDRKNAGASARQLLSSYYMFLFQLPVLPEQLLSRKFVERGIARVEMLGRADAANAVPLTRDLADRTNGINLYRANAADLMLRPKPARTRVPTLVLVPVDDPFARARVAAEAPVPWVDDLTVIEIPGSHWVVTARADLVAMHVADYIDGHTVAPAGAKKKSRR